MARSHGVLKTEVWEPVSDFRRLDLDQQWAYAMLVSQPLINNVGVQPYVPEKWVRLASGLTSDRLTAALAGLERQRYTITDPGAGELLIRTFIRHDAVWKQPKLVTNARRLIREVESDTIRAYLAERHPWLVDDGWTPARIRIHETKKRTPETPTDTPPGRPSETPSDTPTLESVENHGSAIPLTEGVNDGVRARVRDGLPQPPPLQQLTRAVDVPSYAAIPEDAGPPDDHPEDDEQRPWIADNVQTITPQLREIA